MIDGAEGWEDSFRPPIIRALVHGVTPPDLRNLVGGKQQSENHKTMLLGIILLRAAAEGYWKQVLPLFDEWLKRNERELWGAEPATGSHGNQHLEGAAAILRACRLAGDKVREARVLALLRGVLWIYQACDPWRSGESIYPGARSTGEARGRKAWLSNSRQSGAGRSLYQWVYFGAPPGPIEKKGGADGGAMIALEVGEAIKPKDVTKPPRLRDGPLIITVHEQGHVARMPNLAAFRPCKLAWGLMDGGHLVDAGYDIEPPADLGAPLRELRAA